MLSGLAINYCITTSLLEGTSAFVRKKPDGTTPRLSRKKPKSRSPRKSLRNLILVGRQKAMAGGQPLARMLEVLWEGDIALGNGYVQQRGSGPRRGAAMELAVS